MTKDKSKGWIENPSMNIFYLPGCRMAKGGSDCLIVVKEDVIKVRSRVSEIMFANPTMMTTMMERDRRPPVKVLYWVYELYLRSCEEQKRSSWWMIFLRPNRTVIFEYWRFNINNSIVIITWQKELETAFLHMFFNKISKPIYYFVQIKSILI